MDKKHYRNISSPLRTGFDYQTVWAFRFCFNLLSEPSKFKWIHLETKPFEYPVQEPFFLDDIIVQLSDGSVGMYQVKTNLNWDFETLLKQERNRKNGTMKDSLIQKWSKSFFKYEGHVFEAALITMGAGDAELSRFIKSDYKIDINLLRKEKSQIFSQFIDQIGSEKKVKEFLEGFQFWFCQPDINKLEAETRSLFFENLRATANGMSNLLLNLHKAIREEFTQPLKVEDIKNLCEFDRPRPLHQEFSVPSDFQLFDSNMHSIFLKEIENNETGVRVFVGNPGAGKSTYLSNLTRELREKKVIVIRHHYHIDPSDPQPVERMRSERVIEGIKAQLKDEDELLGQLAYQNSQNISVAEFLQSLADASREKNKIAVVIIDGLDHAVRCGYEHDLKKALREICNPQPGLWFLFGLQPAAKSYIPETIISICPESEWVQVPGLNKFSLIKLVEKNEMGLHLPDMEYSFDEFCEELYRISQGNPLHLRYTLSMLRNRRSNKPVNSFDCQQLPSYQGDIEIYYQALWRELPVSGKTALISISLIDAKMHSYNLSELISTFEIKPGEVTRIFNNIRHLLKDDPSGLTIYHNSFDEFLKSSPEFCEQKISTQKALLNWIRNSADNFLKWSELAKLEYKLGNPNLLLSLDYNWVKDGLKIGLPAHLMIAQLNEASKAALELMQFSKLFLYSHLKQYLENAVTFNSDAFESTWVLALFARETPIRVHQIEKLTIVQLEALALMAHFQKDRDLFEQIVKNLNERHTNQQYGEKGGSSWSRPVLAEALIKVLSLDGDQHYHKTCHYLKKYRTSGWSGDLFGLYAKCLFRNGQIGTVKKVLKNSLNKEELYFVEKECTLFDLGNSVSSFQDIFQKNKHINIWNSLYNVLKGRDTPSISAPSKKSFPQKIEEHNSSKQDEIAQIYVEIFLKAIVSGLGNSNVIEDWCSQLPRRWPFPFVDSLVRFSKTVADKIKLKNEILFEDLFLGLVKISPLKWLLDRDVFGYQRAIPKAIHEILVIIDAINREFRVNSSISKKRLERLVYGDLFIQEFFYRDKWLNIFLELPPSVLDEDAIDWYLEQEENLWLNNIVHFNERSLFFSQLGMLAKHYGRSNKQQVYLDLSCRNLIAYGNHKDMYLDEVIGALIKVVHLDPELLKKWAIQLSPIIKNIEKYTDGDETGDIPEIFVDLLGEIDLSLAINYYRDLSDREDFYTANVVFSKILKFLDCSNPISNAICETAIDDKPYNELKRLAKLDSSYQKSLHAIHCYVGELPGDRERENSGKHDYLTEEKKDFDVIPEEILDERLEEEATPWLKTTYLYKWAMFKIEQGCVAEVEMINILYKRISDVDEQEMINDELLDYLYPRFLSIDRNESFRLLCLAQQNGNGWSKYWGSRELREEKRWEFLKKNFPQRVDEFYQKTLRSKFDGDRVFCPIDKAVKFFLYVDKPERALELLESAINFADLLMAGIQFPKENWFSMPRASEADLLLSRLIWPSPSIRERAATGIGVLIKEKKFSAVWVLELIKKHRLETMIVTTLLPLQKASSLGYKFKCEELLPYIQKSSLAIEKIVMNICYNTHGISQLKSKEEVLYTYPNGYEPSEFFRDNITKFLPPYYLDSAQDISRNCYYDFVVDWAFESGKLLVEHGKKEELGSYVQYTSGYESPIYSFSPKISEIYKSAFIRTLSHYNKLGRLSDSKYIKLIDKTIPVDLSFWSISPQKSPVWWPQNKEASCYSDYQKELITFSVDKKLSILPEVEGKLVIGLDGAVKPKEGWLKGIPRTRVFVSSFLYSVHGPNLPEASEIIAEIEYLSELIVPPTNNFQTISFLSASEHVVINRDPIKVGDINIYPLLGRVQQNVINIWQYWRTYAGSFVPTMYLGECAGVESSVDSWKFLDSKGKQIGYAAEWIESLSERVPQSYELQHGTYFLVDQNYLESLLKRTGLRQAHVVKFSHKVSLGSRREYDIVEESNVFGLSPLII